MAGRAIDRRNVLRGAGFAAGGAAIGALGFATPAAATGQGNQGEGGGSLSASWLIIRQDDGTPTTVTGVLSFASGNVMVEHDINPAGPPFTGTWAFLGNGRFRATFWSGQSGQGPNQPGPTLQVRLTGQVKRGNLTGSYTFTAFDPTTGAEIQTGTGKILSGHRIDA
jgi:hypothetical protein